MKLQEVKKEYGLNQTIFYQWMVEQKFIEETDKGYAVGPNALEGMKTLATSYSNDAGQTIDRTQVMIEDAQIPALILQYENSGKTGLYADEVDLDKKEKDVSELTSELAWAEKRINVLENQVKLLTSQMKLIMNHIRRR
ncbi:hypothetical protein I6N96_08035 [Enterococcus sp. BWM-S5]|uniref:Uncharacterized protein n=1 Tax=Enterococcus larvae TaxID=2794352 RepID=A0ABS4CHX7_9ENTE|nr:hypothetical protein [Enterococcus larvae]MBP1046231.1 hypothetical protein [Enterococcus larvae]